MALDEISQVFKTDTAHICTALEQQIPMFLPLPPDSEEKGSLKTILTMSTLTLMIFTALGISICI